MDLSDILLSKALFFQSTGCDAARGKNFFEYHESGTYETFQPEDGVTVFKLSDLQPTVEDMLGGFTAIVTRRSGGADDLYLYDISDSNREGIFNEDMGVDGAYSMLERVLVVNNTVAESLGLPAGGVWLLGEFADTPLNVCAWE